MKASTSRMAVAGGTATAVAPGRVNLIGEHTDYNGGRVLPVATHLCTRVHIEARTDEQVHCESGGTAAPPIPFEADATGSWTDYVRGVARELRAVGRIPGLGFRARVESDLPQGAGLSSSAALEVASALALAAAFGRPFEPPERPEVAALCQRAEREFVGVPCGIMDQWAALFAGPSAAVELRCSDLASRRIELPPEVELLVVDTGVRHALRDGAYARRLAECEAAREAAAARLGRPLATLSDVSVAELPELESALDRVLERRLRHVVSENARVIRFVEALLANELERAGALLDASHESLRVDYEVSCEESDFLVEQSRDLEAVLGARMTGAGFGGCTLHVLRSGSDEDAGAELAARFERRFGRLPRRWTIRPGAVARLLD